MKGTIVSALLVLGIMTARGDDAQKAPSPTKSQSDKDGARRLADAEKLPVTLPRETPFDYNSKLRNIYLEWYAKSYRYVIAGIPFGPPLGRLSEELSARSKGWQDGGCQACKEHPEKRWVLMGVNPPKQNEK